MTTAWRRFERGRIKADLVPGYEGMGYYIGEHSRVTMVLAGMARDLPGALYKALQVFKALQQ